MPPSKPPVQAHIGLDGRIFYIGMGFLFAGLCVGSLPDLVSGDPWIVTMDGMTFFGYALFLFLAWKKLISFNAAFLIALVLTALNFTSGELFFALWHHGRPMFGNANPQLLLLSGVFGVVAGMAISKWASLLFGVAGLILLILFSLTYKNSSYYQHWFNLFVFIIAGNAANKFYYRYLLEKVVGQLEESLVEVGMLKDKAEELHALNQPSVMFGQHTTALVADFLHDVVVLENELAAVEQAQDLETSSRHVEIMSESILNLNRRIEWVKFVSSATAHRPQELLPIGRVLESAIYPFQLRPNNRDRISFELEPIPQVGVHGYRRWLLQMIENLIALICESSATKIRFRLDLDKPADPTGAVAELCIHDDGTNLSDRLQSREFGLISAAAGQFPAGFSMDQANQGGISSRITLFNIAILASTDE